MDDLDFAGLALRRLIRRLLVVVVFVIVIGLGGALVGLGSMWFLSPTDRGGGCVPDPRGVPIEASAGSGLSAEQRANAAAIVAAGRGMTVPDRGLWVALATALQESELRNLDYGDRDSLGLFQQRPSQGWGTPSQVQQPDYAAAQFFRRLIAVPGWLDMPLWQAAQSVQRSAFPTAYARWEQTAADLLAEIGAGRAVPASGSAPSGCNTDGAQPGVVRSPSGGRPGCVADDPTTTGCVTVTTRSALDQAAAAFGGLRRGAMIRSAGCYASRPANPTSDHPLGKGCDLFPGQAGSFAKGRDVTNGWRAAQWFRDNAAALRVSYVIWQGRIWSQGDPDRDGWGLPYDGGGVYDPSDPVGGHYDHLHVSFTQ